MSPLLSGAASLMLVAASQATVPANYDTRFNITAQVPDSAFITDPQGTPVTEVDLRLIPAGSQFANPITLSADTLSFKPLRLWSNNASDNRVKITLDDGNSGTGSPFVLNSYTGSQLKPINYKITTVEGNERKVFTRSGAEHNYALVKQDSHAEKEIVFVVESLQAHNTYKPGAYSGVVYANVAALP